jgi:integrase
MPKPYQLPDGRWRVAVQVGAGSREHRRRVYLSASSEKLVRERLREYEHAVAAGQRPPDRRLSTGTYLRRWLASLTVRERTVMSYTATLEKHVIPRIGGIVLSQLGPLDLDEMTAGMRRDGIPPATRAYALRVLSVAMNVAVKRKRLIPYNPVDGADRPSVTRRKAVVLTREQARTLRSAVMADRLGPLFVLLASTGVRRGEALALRWGDWDREAGTLRVERTMLYRPGEGFETVAPKTDASKRLLRLSATAQRALREQSRRQAAERIRAGRRWQDNDLMFTAETKPGGALSGATVVHALHRLTERADLPRVRVHDLRHLVGTVLGRKQAQPYLGHANAATTDIYVHLEATDAAEAIDAWFGDELREEAK